MRFICAIFLLSVLMTARARASDTPDFSRYPQTWEFWGLVGCHTNGAAHLGWTNLLRISAFLHRDTVVAAYAVSQDGREIDGRMVYNHSFENSGSKQLSADGLNSLRSAIRELPSRSELPPIDRLVIVSFSAGTNWITRSYDSQSLPNAMRKIYDAIGERLETKDQGKKGGF
jgi:hypothetical protein